MRGVDRRLGARGLSGGAQDGEQVVLGRREQAVAQLAVGGQPQPVAVAAERRRDRRDDADRLRAAVEHPPLGRRSARARAPASSVQRADSASRISSRVTIRERSHVCPASSGICSMNRSSAPWSSANATRSTSSSSLTSRIATALSLRGRRPDAAAAAIPSSTSSSRSRRVRSRNRSRRSVSSEMLSRPSPASMRPGSSSRQPDAVRRHREFDRRAVRPLDRGESPHDVDDVGAQQRLAAGEAEGRDAGGRGDPRDALDLVEGQDARAREPLVALLGHAVRAAQRAAVGERDAQVAVHAAVRVDEREPGASRASRRGAAGTAGIRTPIVTGTALMRALLRRSSPSMHRA